MSRPVSRILCPVRTGRRPSIWAHRRRVPRAVHPQARASSPRTPAQPHREVRSSTLLRAGFTEPPRSPGALVRSYRTVSPLPHGPGGPRAVCFLWHCPAGHPGLPLATALLCGVRTFLGTRRDTIRCPFPAPRPPGRLIRRNRVLAAAPTDTGAGHGTGVASSSRTRAALHQRSTRSGAQPRSSVSTVNTSILHKAA